MQQLAGVIYIPALDANETSHLITIVFAECTLKSPVSYKLRKGDIGTIKAIWYFQVFSKGRSVFVLLEDNASPLSLQLLPKDETFSFLCYAESE